MNNLPLEMLTYSSLTEFVAKNDIDATYRQLGMDYVCLGPPESDGSLSTLAANFSKKINWKVSPNLDDLRRIFNQVNTYYASRYLHYAGSGLSMPLLFETNRILLYRQGKHLGIRERNVAFGSKKHLPLGDPFRGYKWLLGMPPQQICRAIEAWLMAVDRIAPSKDTALFLTLALIAIHPFTDANGRLARITFSKLVHDWKLGETWLNEGTDGELLRVGNGLNSTEFLMGRFISEIVDYRNNLDPGSSSFRDRKTATEMMERFVLFIEKVTESPETLGNMKSFCELRNHLRELGHFVTVDPRFTCLKLIIN